MWQAGAGVQGRACSGAALAGSETECREHGLLRQYTMPSRPVSAGRFSARCGHAT